MRAARDRRQAEIENAVALNHMASEMNALAGVGKPRPLDEYLKRVRPAEKATPAQMLERMQAWAALSREAAGEEQRDEEG